MDVKARAAMFGAKKQEAPPIQRRTTNTKIAVAGVFGGGQNKVGQVIEQEIAKKVDDKIKEQGSAVTENNPFLKKTTVKLDQDKSKFMSSNAKEDNSSIVNPFVKAQSEPVKKLNPFEAAQQRKKEEEAKKAAEKPAATEKKMNPFEAAQQRKKEEEAKKAAEKPKPAEKKPNAFELAQQQKKDQVASTPATSSLAPPVKKLNPFEAAQLKRKEEKEAKDKALAEEKAKNAPKKLDPSQMIQIPTQRKAPDILVRQPTADLEAAEKKKNDFAEKQKNLAMLLQRGPVKKNPQTLTTKEKIKTAIFDDDEEEKGTSPRRPRSPSANRRLGVDSLIENQMLKPTLKQDRRPSQRYKNVEYSDSD